jgi:hypothetical protein
MLLRIGLLVACLAGLAVATPMTHGEVQICADSWECQLGSQKLVSMAEETLAPMLTAGAETKPTLLERLEDLLLACFDSSGCLASADTLALYLTETH